MNPLTSTQFMEQVFTPWVMRSAWNKVQAWYATGELYDVAEYLAWQADPWTRLNALADELSQSTYRPAPFPMIPYPKKGDRTRHFVVPSVRDQVAFTVYLILLGPFLEARMPNVSFGHRLYRPRILQDGRWHTAPFSLSHPQVYDPFASGYGLFRRLLQWLTNDAILKEDFRHSSDAGDDLEYQDRDRLPYWGRGLTGDLRYARLDLSAAYPSVDREKLATQLQVLVTNSEESTDGLDLKQWGMPFFPTLASRRQDSLFNRTIEQERSIPPLVIKGQVWNKLIEEPALRVELAQRLGSLIQAIEHAPWEEPWDQSDLTNPRVYHPEGDLLLDRGMSKEDDQYDNGGLWGLDCHLQPDALHGNRYGLPTGLAISGLLLNVALCQADLHMCRRFDAEPDLNERVIYLRFVDDVVMLAKSDRAMGDAIRTLRSEITDASARFYLHPGKTEPESVAKFLETLKSDPRALLRMKGTEYLTRANVETFTTTVVREMSGLAEEALEETFGSAGVDRLNQLIELAARSDEDSEVGTDARLSFSVNKLARAAWPKTYVRDNGRLVSPLTYVERVMNTAERAFRKHPWRFKLWKSMLIIALRANVVEQGKGEEWLRGHILPLLRWNLGRTMNPSDRCWEQGEGEDGYTKRSGEQQAALNRRYQHRRLRTSFHRAWFWRQWAACVRELVRMADGELSADPGYWGSHFTQDQAKQGLLWFGKLGEWAELLYPRWDHTYWPQGRSFLWWWEAEALHDAILSRLSPTIGLLNGLGNPRPNQLRHSLTLSELDLVLPHELKFEPIRQALQNIMGWSGWNDESVPDEATRKLALLWLRHVNAEQSKLTEFFDGFVPDGTISPAPGTDPAAWAALARVDLWPAWVGLKEITPGTAPPQVPGPESWRRIAFVDTYGSLRRLQLAHGQNVQWDQFRAWFPELSPGKGGRRRNTHKTLLEAMYQFTNNMAPPDGLVPSVELEAHTAYALTKAACSTVEQTKSGVLTPDTVHLSPEAFALLSGLRAKLLRAGAAPEQGRETDTAEAANYRTDAMRDLVKLVSSDAKHLIDGAQPLTNGCRAPHPLFLYPEMVLSSSRRVSEKWRSALLLLWLLCGGERILDQLWRTAPWHPPLSERDDYRSTLVLPEGIWSFLEKRLGSVDLKVRKASSRFIEEEPQLKEPEPLVKVRDIYFDQAGDWFVAPPSSLTDLYQSTLENLHVRLVQATATIGDENLTWADGMSRPAPSFGRATYEAVAAELADRLREARGQARLLDLRRGDDSSEQHHPDDLLLLPEWFTPAPYVGRLKQFVRETGVGVLSGVLIRELPRAVPVVPRVMGTGWRVLVNEATLVVPNKPHRQTAAEGISIPSRVYEFRIRKPYPAVLEAGLIRHLADQAPTASWAFLGGTSWYRWTYHDWGCFSVAICSDILDTFIWDWLRGRIQHLFIPAWNTDIELFDQFAWTRGYELFANVACVNHGSMGGSMAWTPKHSHSKEIFRVHGPNKGLAVTVSLPVAKMIEAQDSALADAIKAARGKWAEAKTLKNGSPFKSPPPGYYRKP